MEQNTARPGSGIFLELFVTGHLTIVKGDFIGDEATEENVGVLFLFVLEEEMNFFSKEFGVLFLFLHERFDFAKRVLDFLLLVRLQDIADDEQEAFIRFELLFGELAEGSRLRGLGVGGALGRGFRLYRTIGVRHVLSVSECL